LPHQRALEGEASVLLTKQRKRMSSKVMKKLVYIRYEKKYRKWVKGLRIKADSEKVLKKMELMGTKMKYWTKTWLS